MSNTPKKKRTYHKKPEVAHPDSMEVIISEKVREYYPKLSPKHMAVVVEYICNGGNITKAYQKVYPNSTAVSAAALGSMLFRELDIGLILDLMGHGLDKIHQAMDALLIQRPQDYMKYQAQLRKWEVTKVEHSGKIELPIINILTQPKKE